MSVTSVGEGAGLGGGSKFSILTLQHSFQFVFHKMIAGTFKICPLYGGVHYAEVQFQKKSLSWIVDMYQIK